MKKLLFFQIAFLFSFLLAAQKTLSLEQCIELANENNIDVRQTTINSEIARQNVLQSRGNLLPTVNGTVSHNYNLGRTIDPFTNQFTNNRVRSNNFALAGSLTLFNGFQIQNTLKQSEFNSLATGYDMQLIKNNTALNITSIYLQILFNEELIALAENQLSLTKLELERMNKLVAAGKTSAIVLPDLEAQQANEEVRLVNAQNQMRINYVTLSQLLNIDPEESLKISRPAVIFVQDTTELKTKEVFETALQQQPQIKSAEYRKLSSLKSYAVARGRMSPRLSLNASLSTLFASSSLRLLGYQQTGTQVIGFTGGFDSVYAPVIRPQYEKKPFNDQFKDNLNKFWGFTLTIPILNSLQVRTSIAREKLGLQTASLNLEQAKISLHRAIVVAYVDASNAKKRIEASKVAANAAEIALRNAEKRLQVGQINSFDYAQVKNRSTQSSSDLLQANYDYIFKTKILEFYQGKALKL